METRTTRTVPTLCAVAAAMVVAAGSAAAPSSMLDPADPLALEVKALHDDISLANLIRGLGLTGDQLDALAEVAGRAEALRDEHNGRAQPLLTEMESAFAALRAELLAGGHPADEVEARAVGAQHQLQDQRREFERSLADLELELRTALDDGQITIIEEFKPCLIPPHELGEPLRVGQADSGGKALEVLGELRTLPANSYARRLPRFVDRGMEIVELRTGPLADEAHAEYRDRLTGLVEEVRTVDDVGWALEGEGYAKRLREIVEGQTRHPSSVAEGSAELTRVGRLLLAPGSAQVLADLAACP